MELPQDPNPLAQAFLEAGREIGLPVVEDNNAAEMEGVSHFNLTIKNGKRHSVARAYLYLAMERPNLTVPMYAETRRLVCEGTHCRGVEYTLRGEVKTTRAVREIVLCAGAIGSPRVLLLSGIGPAEDLKWLGIPVVVNLPGVGRNCRTTSCWPVFSMKSTGTCRHRRTTAAKAPCGGSPIHSCCVPISKP
jgi:choline dehydrogenase